MLKLCLIAWWIITVGWFLAYTLSLISSIIHFGRKRTALKHIAGAIRLEAELEHRAKKGYVGMPSYVLTYIILSTILVLSRHA